jgi:hypothetical protein
MEQVRLHVDLVRIRRPWKRTLEDLKATFGPECFQVTGDRGQIVGFVAQGCDREIIHEGQGVMVERTTDTRIILSAEQLHIIDMMNAEEAL